MARNPFYPGYYPEKQGQIPSNPLYPGYYPGKKLSRKPIPKGRQKVPFMGFGGGDTAAEFLDSFADEVKHTFHGPFKWVQERYADDFAQSLKITSLPPQGVTQEGLDDYETGSLPGGGFIQLNIDPREWVGVGKPGRKWLNEDGTVNRDKEAPKKMLKKTLTSWAKSALNFWDLETQARGEFWGGLLKGEYDPDKHSITENKAYELITGQIPVKDQPNPFSLKDQGIYEGDVVKSKEDINGIQVNVERQKIFKKGSDEIVVVEKQYHPATATAPAQIVTEMKLETGGMSFADWQFSKDVYLDAAHDTKDFMMKTLSPIVRDSSHDKAQGSLLHAVSTELKYSEGISGRKTMNPDIEFFTARTDLTASLGDLGKGLFDANKDVRQALASGISLGKPELERIQKSFRGLEGKYNEVVRIYSGLDRVALTKARRPGITNEIDELDTNLKNLGKVFSSTDFQLVKNATSPAGIAPSARKVLSGINMSPGALNVARGGGITGGHIFTPSVQRAFQSNLGGEACLSTLSSAINQPTVGKGARAASILIPRVSLEREVGVVNEFESTVLTGKWFEAGAWTKGVGRIVDPTVSPLAPKYLVERLKNGLNNFGLVVDNKILESKGWDFDHIKAPSNILGNRFSFSLQTVVGGRNTKVRVKTWGGDHYNAINTLEKWMNNADKTGEFITQTHLKDLLVKDKNFLTKEVTSLFNAKIFDRKKLIFLGGVWKYDIGGGNIVELVSKEFQGLGLAACETREALFDQLEKLHKLQSDVAQSREHIKNRLRELGLNPNDYEHIRKYIDELHSISGNKGITARYLGLMQKLGHGINRFEQAIYKIPVVGKAAEFANGLRLIARELKKRIKAAIKQAVEKVIKEVINKVGAALTKAAIKLGVKVALKAIASAIAIAANVIAPFIASVIAWLIVKLIELVGKLIFGAIKAVLNFTKRLMKGELTAYLEEAEKKLDKNARRLIYIILIVVLISSFFSPLIGFIAPGGVVPGGILFDDPFSDAIPFSLSTFSPNDPTRKWGTLTQFYEWDINLDYGSLGEPTPGGGGGCANMPKALPADPPPTAETARAYQIAEDLERGFWGMYNHSITLFPNSPYWNAGQFAADPNPDPTVARGSYQMFWCTCMIFESLAIPKDWGCDGMLATSRGATGQFTVLPRQDATLGLITPGSIIFFGTPSDMYHVALVYSKNSSGITTIESNNCNVSYFIPATCDGADCPLTETWAMPIQHIAILK